MVSTGSIAKRLLALVVDSGWGNCRLGCEGEEAIADRKLRVGDGGVDTSSPNDGFSQYSVGSST